MNGTHLVHTSDGQVVEHRGIGVGFVDGVVWNTSHPEVTGWLAGPFDSMQTTPHWFPTDVTAPLDCPADSDAARICDPLWAELEARLAVVGQEDPQMDTGTPVEGEVELQGCGCSHGAPAAAWWILFLPLLRYGRWSE